MSFQKDIVLLNNFLGSMSELERCSTPKQYIDYANARMAALGFQVEIPKGMDFSADWGDVYLLLDRFKDANEPEVNQLATKMGESFYMNLVWNDGGVDIIATIVPESDIDKEGSEVGDLYGIPDFE